jgi:HupE / UreJ protein
MRKRNEAMLKSGSALRLLAGVLLALLSVCALAHNVGESDQQFLTNSAGTRIVPFIYLGTKHMVTGYDHLLFLVGVIFFLYRLKHVALYVSIFAVGHSITLLAGVLWGWQVNAYVVDAIIGLSVAYKAFDNLNGFRTLFGFEPPPRTAVLIFGLFHGLGLATKLQELKLSPQGLLANLISFNVGVEIGQFLALAVVLIAMNYWRGTASFLRHAYATNVLLMTAGFLLAGLQISGYLLAR